MSVALSQGLHVDLDWWQSQEGLSILSLLKEHPSQQTAKFFGFLNHPNVPPTFNVVQHKLGLVGKAGVGKSTIVSLLAGTGSKQGSNNQGETPGIRVTKLYWPVKIAQQALLFDLEVWDGGEAASKKYSHITPACRQNASALIYVFSFTDKSSFDEVENLLARRADPHLRYGPIVIGTKYGLMSDVQVSQSDVVSLESRHNISVLRVRHRSGGSNHANFNSAYPTNESALILNLICGQLVGSGALAR